MIFYISIVGWVLPNVYQITDHKMEGKSSHFSSLNGNNGKSFQSMNKPYSQFFASAPSVPCVAGSIVVNRVVFGLLPAPLSSRSWGGDL